MRNLAQVVHVIYLLYPPLFRGISEQNHTHHRLYDTWRKVIASIDQFVTSSSSHGRTRAQQQNARGLWPQKTRLPPFFLVPPARDSLANKAILQQNLTPLHAPASRALLAATKNTTPLLMSGPDAYARRQHPFCSSNSALCLLVLPRYDAKSELLNSSNIPLYEQKE